MRHLGQFLLIVSTVLLAATACTCGPDEQSDQCRRPGEGGPVRNLIIGELDSAGVLVPYTPGQDVDLIRGNQGSDMVTPAFRLSSLEGDEDDTLCVAVTLANTMDGETRSVTRHLEFNRKGDSYESGALENALFFSVLPLRGRTLEMNATLASSDATASSEISVRLKCDDGLFGPDSCADGNDGGQASDLGLSDTGATDGADE